MNFLDMRTVLISYVLSNVICLAVVTSLWKLSRDKFQGIGLWVVDYWLQLIAIVIISLRGIIPFSWSVLFGVPLSITGTFILYLGLEKNTGKRSRQVHNYILLFVLFAVHLWFSYGYPSLQARNINFSAGLLLLSIQIAWLLLYRVETPNRLGTQVPGLIFAGYCAFSIIRIVADTIATPSMELFSSGTYDVAVILAYQMLFIALTFGLSLKVNRDLFSQLELDMHEIKHIQETLRISEEKFALAFRDSPYALIITRMNDGKMIELNRAFYEITGYAPADTLDATTLNLALWANTDDRKEVIDALIDKQKVHGREYQFRCKDGKMITGLFSSDILVLNGEKCILSSIADISSRKEAEDAVKELNEKLEARVLERTAELESSMLELESFSYTVSHDLRSPIRAINGFSNILMEDYHNVLDEEALRLCSVIKNNAQDMGMQIDDLIAFTQLGRAVLHRTHVDMTAMVKSVIAEILSPQEQARTSISLEVLPDADCDAKLIRLVLVNLIRNSIKFSSLKPESIISIKAEQQANQVVYSVSDNGIGVDMRYSDKLFRVFQKLHTAQEFEGRGMGLAVAHRIILKHGGKAWIDGEPGSGATVFFTLKSEG